jgi:outer membrane protein assembly factor BamB
MELLRRYLPAVRPVALGLALLLSGFSCRPRLSLPDGPGDRRGWHMAGGEADHRAWSSERLALPLELRWRVRTRGSVTASPVVIGDVICVGTLGKRFYFFSAADGSRHATLKTDAGISAAAAVGDESIYVATGVEEGVVYALDLREGEILWKTAVGDVSAPLTYHRGAVLVGTNLGKVWCLTAEDGSSRWQFSTHGMKSTAVAVSGDMALCGCDAGYLYALGIEDGEERWSRQLEGAVWARPAAADGRIYAGTFKGYLYCLTEDDGEIIWRRDLDGSITRPLALAPEMIYAGTDRGLLTALDHRSGRTLWEHRLAGARPGAPLATPDALLVGDSEGGLNALSAETGEVLWSHQADGAIISAPVLWQGSLYVGSMNDDLSAFSPADSGTTAAVSARAQPAGNAGTLSP